MNGMKGEHEHPIRQIRTHVFSAQNHAEIRADNVEEKNLPNLGANKDKFLQDSPIFL